MQTQSSAGFASYMATPLMSIVGNVVASLVFIYGLGDSSPVPVFAAFTVINIINMSLFALLPFKRKHIARRVNMVLFTFTLVVLFGTLGRQNFQIEGLFFLTAAGLFGGVTTHFLVAKIVGPIFFGRNWCGWSCWTALILDMFPFKDGGGWRGTKLKHGKFIHFAFSLVVVMLLVFGFGYTIHNPNQQPGEPGTVHEMVWFIAGYGLYYLVGIAFAFYFKDNRAFCKYLCPVAVFMKGGAVLSMLRICGDKDVCTQCGQCISNCIMDINIPAYTTANTRVLSSECTMCMQCISACPVGALKASVGMDFVSSVQKRERLQPLK